MEISVIIDDKIVKKLKKALRVKTFTNVVRFGLVILSWMIDETNNKRVIYSVNQKGEDKRQLVLPWITKR